MKKVRNVFINNLRYLCLVGVIALGFMTIIATGGGEPELGTAPRINYVEFYDENDLVTPIVSFNTGQKVYFVAHVTDPDLDISTLTVIQYYPQDSSTPYYGPDSITLSSQPAADAIVYNITPVTVAGPAGIWRIEFQLADSKGNESNVFTEYVSVNVGIQWTERTSGVTPQLNSVVWSGTLFVIVGYNGVILTSSDGVNWTTRTSGTDNALFGVTWSGTQFVAVGENGTILTSPDGTNWTKRNSGVSNSYLYDISWSGTQFVAVGDKVLTSGAEILTSPDGVIWTKITSGITNGALLKIIWSGTKYVAVGGAIIATSTDGTNWTQITLDTYSLLDIIWAGSQFVAVGGDCIVATSLDGINWESRSLGAQCVQDIYGVSWSGYNFVAVGSRIFTSPDAINWTQTSSTLGLRGVTWSGTQYVAVGFAGRILTSP